MLIKFAVDISKHQKEIDILNNQIVNRLAEVDVSWCANNTAIISCSVTDLPSVSEVLAKLNLHTLAADDIILKHRANPQTGQEPATMNKVEETPSGALEQV